nr:hypothetical protein BdHM001_35700 [Bdellovibrio sp. HM001]
MKTGYTGFMKTILMLIAMYSNANGLDPYLVAGLIKTESSFNTKAVGGIGEIGLMQLRPEFFAEPDLGPIYKTKTPSFLKGTIAEIKEKDLFDPETNIRKGTAFLRQLKKSCPFKDDVQFVICFNRGVRGARNVSVPQEDPYYKKVSANREHFKSQNIFTDTVIGSL